MSRKEAALPPPAVTSAEVEIGENKEEDGGLKNGKRRKRRRKTACEG